MSSSRRLRHLDGLRGLAALAVVFSHVVALGYLPWDAHARTPAPWEYALWHLGAPAVDLFFVLSGFVVARAVWRGAQGDLGFILRRLARLLPMAWLAVLLGFSARALLAHHQLPGESGAVAELRAPLSPGNWLGALSMLWPGFVAGRVNPPLWTLIVEVQAALYMPWLARAVRGSGAVIAALLAGAGVVLHDLGWQQGLYLGLFALGAWLATLQPEATPPLRAAVAAPLLAASLALLLSRHLSNDERETWRLLSMFGAAGVIYLTCRFPAARRLLAARPLGRLGQLSYALYAVHFPVLIAVALLLTGLGAPLWAAGLAGVPVSLAVAALAWRLIERPALAWSAWVGRTAGRAVAVLE